MLKYMVNPNINDMVNTKITEYTKEDIIMDDDNPLVFCKNCGKLVLKTNLCIYCGSPILFKMPSGKDE